MPEAAVSAWFPLQWAMAVTSRRLLPFGHLLNVGPSRKSSGTLNSCFSMSVCVAPWDPSFLLAIL